MINLYISRPYSKDCRSLVSGQSHGTPSTDDLIQQLIKYEKEIEANKRLISILDERAGPAIVSDNDSSDDDTMPIPTVEHEVVQRDPLFAKSFEFTTNVSIKP